MGEEGSYYMEISYKEWKKINRTMLWDSYAILVYYIQQYNNIDNLVKKYNIPESLVDIINSHYTKKIKSQLETFLDNLDMYNIGTLGRDKYKYYIDLTTGSPIFSYYPVKKRKSPAYI